MYQYNENDIAIIGFSCRFPGAKNAEEFWKNILNGEESITFYENSDPELERAGYINAGGYLDDIEYFDANFFGYSDNDAKVLDPQQRIFLECCYETLESSGYYLNEKNNGRIGVYGGCGPNNYLVNNILPSKQKNTNCTFLETAEDLQMLIGNDRDYLTTRASYKLGLTGPSINLQTACSTSLVAVHLACQSIINGECDMAIAGASYISVPDKTGYWYEEDMVFSKDGHCRAFDRDASGTVFSSGVGVVLLKSLEQAIRDNDTIHAVIKGSSINNDGSDKTSYASPSVSGQSSSVHEAMFVSGVNPESITYIEAHGTGTKLGDPIEIESLKQAFSTNKKQYCALGTVKTNIGHTGWASGIAGLIKVIYMLKEKKLPPSLHYNNPNPYIDFENSPFYVNKRLCDWDVKDYPRRAGVSSFGLGGTNAHVILEEYPGNIDINSSITDIYPVILPISAKSDISLRKISKKYGNFLREETDVSVQDFCFTAATKRYHFKNRAIIIGFSREDLIHKLETSSFSFCGNNESNNTSKKIALLFTGHGGQYKKMAYNLYLSEPLFKREVDLVENYLIKKIEISLTEILFGDNSDELLKELKYAQLGIFAIEYALAKYLIQLGIKPHILLGHSLGEYAAACIGGYITLNDTIDIIIERTNTFSLLKEDSLMLAVFESEDIVRMAISKLNPELIGIGAVNTKKNTVVTGMRSLIEELQATLNGSGIKTVKLNIPKAGHSPLISERMLQSFEEKILTINPQIPQIPMISNLTGEVIEESPLNAKYWVKHMRNTVRFKESIDTLAKSNISVIVEVGPKPTLLGLVEDQLEDFKGELIPTLIPGSDDIAQILAVLGRLYISGVHVNWKEYYKGKGIRKQLVIPTYQFDRKKYWVESSNLHKNIKEKQEGIFIDETWEEKAIVKENATNISSDDILIFVDDQDNGKILGELMSKQGYHVIYIYKGNKFLKISENEYFIDANRGVDKLFNSLEKEVTKAYNILYFWGIDIIDESLKKQDFGNLMKNSYGVILEILKHLLSIHNDNKSKLYFVTKNAKKIDVGDKVEGHLQSIIWGMKRVISMENSELKSYCFDFDFFNEDTLSKIIDEMKYNRYDELIGFRGGKRYSAILKRRLLSRKEENLSQDTKNDICLITGGLGGIGTKTAEWLLKNTNCKVVLVGRREIDHKKTVELDHLRKFGPRIEYIQCDIANPIDIKSMFNYLEKIGVLKSIYHAAGVIKDATILNQDAASFELVLLPKLIGTINLHQECIDRNIILESFVLYSSVTSLIGNIGQINHAAANAFLDSFAAFRNGNGLKAVSINWGAWGDTGELSKSIEVSEQLSRRGIYPFNSIEGIKALDYILANDLNGQIGYAKLDLNIFLEIDQKKNFYFKNFVNLSDDSICIENNEGKKNHEIGSIKSMLEGTIREVLGNDNLFRLMDTQNESFFNFGLDSLLAIKLKNKLQLLFSVTITANDIFKYSTINLLVAYIDSLISAKHTDNNNISSDSLSVQQIRWLSLIKKGYGQRAIPIIYDFSFSHTYFIDSLTELINRHELLQYYYPNAQIKKKSIKEIFNESVDILDFSQLNGCHLEDVIANYYQEFLLNVPDPEKEVTWKITGIKLTNQKFAILLFVQHIDFDGSSLSVFTDEFRAIYASRLRGTTLSLGSARQYYEYIKLQKDYEATKIEIDRSYFKGVFSTLGHHTYLPNHPGFDITTPLESDRYSIEIDCELWQNIKSVSQENEITPFSIILASYFKLISDITGNNDLTIFMITNGRNKEIFDSVIGPFTSPFPIRAQITESTTLELATQCHKLIMEINERSNYPVSDLIGNISAFNGLPNDTYFSDVGINFVSYKKENRNLEGNPRTLEILGPVSEPGFKQINNNGMKRIPGLDLIVGVTKDALVLNYWYHLERFNKEKVINWSNLQLKFLKDLK